MVQRTRKTSWLVARLALLVLLVDLALTGASAATIDSFGVDRPEGTRHYLLARPDSPRAGSLAMIILLHGHGGTASQLMGQQRSVSPMALWLQLADREGLLLAAPDGAAGADGKPGWNDCRADARSNPKTDDVGFIDAIVAREVSEHQADPQRIFVMGMSNGGMMAFRYAIERGARLAGFAAVSASMAADTVCPAPAQALAALIVSGTADPLVPYGGGNVGFRRLGSRGGVIGVEAAAGIWRQLDGLAADASTTTAIDHRDPTDPTRATRIVWGGSPGSTQVELIRIEGGGHVEPSARLRVGSVYARLVGAQNGDFEVAEEAWHFFRDKHQALPP